MVTPQKVKMFWRRQSHACKSYASSDNVDILNYFNPELQLKDTE